ncbi:PGF-pre-PGF domain-containing protein [Candidatus Woesearchaeota archaeon]|nr:PGF-pre-PGF domain-containing protein [Candidatus Woesearchaeota archaeon]
MKKEQLIIGFSALFLVLLTLQTQACTNTTDDLYINNNTVLCGQTLSITDLNDTGIIIFNASNILLDCNNTAITGNNNGTGINITNFNNITIKNCDIASYQNNIRLHNTDLIVDDNTYSYTFNITGTGTASFYQNLSINVIDGVSNNLANVTITIFDNDNNTVYTDNTSVNGTIPSQKLITRKINITNTTDYNNYTINISNIVGFYQRSGTSVNISQNNQLTFTFYKIVTINVTDLQASTRSDGSIRILWSYDSQPEITKYNVYRSNTNFTVANSTDRIDSNVVDHLWTDTDTLPNATYYYAITGLDSQNNENLSAISNLASITSLPSCTSEYDNCGVWSGCASGEKTRLCTQTCVYDGVNDTITESGFCSSSNQGDDDDGQAVETVVDSSQTIIFSRLKNGTTQVNFSNSDLTIEHLILTIKEQKNGVRFGITKYFVKPSAVPAKNNVFAYLQMDHGVLTNTNLETAKIRFKILKEWFEDEGYVAKNITMYRYIIGWAPLNTSVISEDEEFYHFEAITPGLSYFVIASTSNSTNIEAPIINTVNETDEQTLSAISGQAVQESPAQLANQSTNTTQEQLESTKAKKGTWRKLMLILLVLGGVAGGSAYYHEYKIQKPEGGELRTGLSVLEDDLERVKKRIQVTYFNKKITKNSLKIAKIKKLQELRKYVRTMKKLKIPANIIKQKLTLAGWSDNYIRLILRKKKH